MVAILVILGSTALPRIDAAQQSRIALAAAEVANAIRFARDESVRTGMRHMVIFDTTSQQVQVAELLANGPAPVPLPLARHPLSKQPFVIDLDDDPTLGATVISTLALNYEGVGAQTAIDFTAAGVPHYQSLNTQRRMNSGKILLSLGSVSRVVAVQPLTGAVTVTGGL